MKSTFKLLIALFLIGITISCSSCSSDDDVTTDPINEEPVDPDPDPDPSPSAVNLLNNLRENANQGKVLLGHQATTIAGVGWRLWQMPDHSDFKSISGKFPALYGWEFSPRPDNQNETNDYVTFDVTIAEAKKAYQRGGINQFNLHPYRLDNNANSWNNTPGLATKLIPGGALHDQYKLLLDKYVTEFQKLKDNSGNPIPFVFRPYHEANHNWFWWGNTACTDDEYKTLFRFTVEYMRGKGLTHMLICYAPGYFQNEATYMARYPGDDVVDILGFDGYYGNNNGHGTDWQTLKNHLTLLKSIGESKNKLVAWAETGEQNLATNTYFSQLSQAIEEVGIKISWVMFWANYQNNEFYIPYTDLNNNPVRQNFIDFVNTDKFQAQGEHLNLYN